MPQISTTKSLRRDEVTRGSALDLKALRAVAERLNSRENPRDVVQLLCEEAHECFFPTPAAVLVNRENGLEVAALASSDDRLDWALKSDLSGAETLASAVSEALQNS